MQRKFKLAMNNRFKTILYLSKDERDIKEYNDYLDMVWSSKNNKQAFIEINFSFFTDFLV